MASADVDTGRVPDVIQGRPRPQGEPRARRCSRRTSENSAPSPRGAAPAVDSRRRTSRPGDGGGPRTLAQRRQQAAAALRRSSESALLPPIRVSSVRQAGAAGSSSSPTYQEANNETASSPISTLTFQQQQQAAAGGGGGAGSGGDGELLAPLSEREASLHPSSEATPRLSPITGSDQPPRQQQLHKPERRLPKPDATGSDPTTTTTTTMTPKSPTQESTAPALKPGGARPKPHRRISSQSLPKLSPSEEPFSIRRKIEQFRKWHEEQYAEKLKKLTVDGEKGAREAEGTAQTRPLEIDFAKLLEENMRNSRKKAEGAKQQKKDPSAKRNPAAEEEEKEEKKTTPTSTVGPTPRNAAKRCRSGATWRTWRDVNDSYAYEDVEKYIEENELLPPDRVTWISQWIGDVEKAFSGTTGRDRDVEGNDDDLTIARRAYP
ncbi:uncharacterized protein LOC143290969 [Babylonia areolata]|uniref:uncharacterized protein LOC143290969 n=1 Tax=Babylonia areolata TaxID=304850 RepID=UPI003FD5BB6F